MCVRLLATSFVGMLAISAVPLQGAAIMQSTSAVDWDGGLLGDELDDLTLTLSGMPTNANSDLTVSFGVRAELYLSSQNVSLSVDGLSFGIWLNDNVADDAIDYVFPGGGGIGPEYDQNDDSAKLPSIGPGPSPGSSGFVFRGTSVIPRSIFVPLIADGELNAVFDFSAAVDDRWSAEANDMRPDIYPLPFTNPEFAEFGVSYATADVIPEPATFVVWSILGLCGAGAACCKKGNVPPRR